jgi:hypothetical protein
MSRGRSLPFGLPWVPTALAIGILLIAAFELRTVPTLQVRLVRDGLLFLLIPLAIGALAGRRLGWTVDRRALLVAAGLTLAIVPIYVVGSTLPSVRAGYPMGGPLPAGGFPQRAVTLVALVVATETLYRGLLCVGIREIGPASILVSPILYAFQHLGGVPLAILLSAPADLLFGASDYYADSILPSIAAHSAGLVLLEWLVRQPPLF